MSVGGSNGEESVGSKGALAFGFVFLVNDDLILFVVGIT
jgi:hypothetical protein